jgi:site-specific recombinase XerD
MAERLQAKKARATVNRETGALKQAFNLARKQGRITRVPYIPMLREHNARQGFFEHADFEKLIANLPDPINDIARFAYLTGWRRGEIVSLRWDAVDRQGREVRLRTSKNGEGRVLPITEDLSPLIERRWTARTIQKKDGTTKIAEFVFHRQGEPVVDFRKPWKEGCTSAKISQRLFHDLRRTAVRNMIRAGVPQSIAMSISGHKTVSMFMRYNITSAADKIAALRRTAEHLAAQPTKPEGADVVELKGREATSRWEHGHKTDSPADAASSHPTSWPIFLRKLARRTGRFPQLVDSRSRVDWPNFDGFAKVSRASNVSTGKTKSRKALGWQRRACLEQRLLSRNSAVRVASGNDDRLPVRNDLYLVRWGRWRGSSDDDEAVSSRRDVERHHVRGQTRDRPWHADGRTRAVEHIHNEELLAVPIEELAAIAAPSRHCSAVSRHHLPLVVFVVCDQIDL